MDTGEVGPVEKIPARRIYLPSVVLTGFALVGVVVLIALIVFGSHIAGGSSGSVTENGKPCPKIAPNTWQCP